MGQSLDRGIAGPHGLRAGQDAGENLLMTWEEEDGNGLGAAAPPFLTW